MNACLYLAPHEGTAHDLARATHTKRPHIQVHHTHRPLHAQHANSTKSYSHESLEATKPGQPPIRTRRTHARSTRNHLSPAFCCRCCAAAGDIPRQKKLKSVRGCIASWLPPSAVTAATAADAVAHAGRRMQQPLNGPLRWVRRCARPSCELHRALWSALPRRGA